MKHYQSSFSRFHFRISQLICFLLLVSAFFFIAPASVNAEAAILQSQSYQDLAQAIQQTKDPSRLLELKNLEQAIVNSGDRAQISNQSNHNLGFFSRYKKDPVDAPANFYVLSPGHQSDDDQILLALYVPANVSLSWGEQGRIDAATQPRLVRILDGEQLLISSSVAATDPDPSQVEVSLENDDYQFNLPVFTVENSLPGIASLPNFSQETLDLEPETAPLD